MVDDIQTNVVLTADNSQYDQSMVSSAVATDNLVKSIDSLTGKINQITKSAGRKLLGISAADVAVITGATAAWASYEKQVSKLQAQAAAMTRTRESEVRQMKVYSDSVKSLRKEFGTTTHEAAQLTQTLSKMSDKTRDIKDLAKVFTEMSNATGESSQGLATSLLNLQKVMGTPQRNTRQYADQLVYLASSANTSASALADFASQIAPIGRSVGMTQSEVTGFSKAFIQAGQDGYQAATAFSKVMSDIAYATETGSPKLNQYANLVGMTVENFKNLSGAQQFVAFVDQISKAGPRAVVELNRLGFEGVRMSKSLTALSQQGGLMQALGDSQRGLTSGSTSKASQAAMKGITDELGKLRQELQMTAEAFASFMGPVVAGFVRGIETVAGLLRDVVEGPLGKFAQVIMGLAAPVAGIAGSLFLMAKGLAGFAALNTILRSGPVQGFREQMASNRSVAGGGLPIMGAQARNLESGRASWTNRLFYNSGVGLANMTGAGMGTGPSAMSRLAGWGMSGAGFATRFLTDAVYSPGAARIPFVDGTGGDRDITRRMTMFNAATPGGSFAWMGNIGRGFREGVGERAGAMTGSAFKMRGGGFLSMDEAQAINQQWNKIAGQSRLGMAGADDGRLSQATKQALGAERAATALGRVEREAMSASRGFGAFGRSMGHLVTMLGATALGAAKFGGGIAGHAFNLLGGNPLLAGGLAAYAGFKMVSATTDDVNGAGFTSRTGFNSPYFQAGGITPPSPASGIPGMPAPQLTLPGAYNVTRNEVTSAQSGAYKYTNNDIKNAKSPREAISLLKTQWGKMASNPQAVNAVALDLAARFGMGPAQMIMDVLRNEGGGDPDLTALARDAARPGSKGFMDTVLLRQSGSLANKQLAKAFGALEDRAAFIQETEGSDAAAKFYAQGYQQILKGFDQGGGGFNLGDSSEPSAIFGKAMGKNLFGLDPASISKDSELADPVRSRDLKTFIRNAVVPGRSVDGFSPLTEQQLQIALEKYGLDPALTKDRNKAANALVDAILNPRNTDRSDEENAQSRIRDTTAGVFGSKGFLGLASVERALSTGAEDQNAQVRAINQVAGQVMSGVGGGTGEQIKYLMNIIAASGGDDALGAGVARGALSQVSRVSGIQQGFMTRQGSFGEQARIFQGTMNADLGPDGKAIQEQALDTFAQQAQAQYDYFRNLLLQQREFTVSMQRSEEDFGKTRGRMEEQFGISRKRAYQDFHIARGQQEHDFQLSRRRAEFDFQLQRDRAGADFNRSMRRGSDDFYLSRKRQEQDYHHSVQLMVEQSAKSMMDIYSRVPVAMTNSATFLIQNNMDQVRRMQEQSQNLDRLRGMGMTDDAIQQLGLTDPNNAQQLARLIAEVGADPSLIKQFNQQVAQRLAAASKLTKDESSQEWEEFQRQYELARDRAMEDFQKSVKRAHQDFRRQMAEMEKDFRRQMNRQSEDYETAQDRQQEAFSRSMRRAAEDYGIAVRHMTNDFNTSMTRAKEDLDRSATEISGTMEQILTKAMTSLSKTGRQQAREALGTLRNVRIEGTEIGNDIMLTFARIFGFKYTPIKANGQTGVHQGQSPTNQTGNIPFADGGVIPGFTPGRDVHHFHSPTAGGLSLSGGEAIMRPEWVRAVGGPQAVQEMNRAAKFGAAFADGGLWHTPGQRHRHNSGYPWARWSGDINVPGDGDYGNPVRAWKDGIVAAVKHLTTSYGKHVRINHPGSAEETLYAHLSNIAVSPGQRVGRGQHIGNVGSTGNSSGPHLHFEIKGGTGPIDASAGLAGALPALDSILKNRYPELEAVAGRHRFAGGFPRRNFMSSKINKMARATWGDLRDQYGDEAHTPMGTLDAPSSVSGNQRIVKDAMLRHGWNQWDALYSLVMKESGFRNTAQNPTSSAYGMFQFLDSTWATVGGRKTSDPHLQAEYGMRYIKNRYRDPNGAWKFWQGHNWYADGAMFMGPQMIGVGERGPEAVIPLNDRGADFMSTMIDKYSGGLAARGLNVRGDLPVSVHNQNTYNIDRSTNFTGEIRVVANNPAEFVQQLQQRQRVRALANPTMAGRRIG